MKAITAHAVIIPTTPTDVGNELAADWPSWTELFQNLESLGRKYLNAIGRPLDDYRDAVVMWQALGNPFAGEALARDMVDGYTDLLLFPPVLLRQLYHIPIDNENIISAHVVRGAVRTQAQFFANISFFSDYMRSLKYTVKRDWAFVHRAESVDRIQKYIVIEKEYDALEVVFAADEGHSTEYTVVYNKDQMILSHLWNQLDEWGLKYGLDRLPGEHDMLYARRLNDIFIHPGNASGYGITNAVAREYGLMTNLGNFRIPITQLGASVDELGDVIREDVQQGEFPRILRFTKWSEIVRTNAGDDVSWRYINTTTRDQAVRHVLLRLRGEGHAVITPVPDHIYSYSSVGTPNDPAANATYSAMRATGRDTNGRHIWDPNAMMFETTHNTARDEDTYVILEYRDRVSKVLPDYKPVNMIYLRENTYAQIDTPYAADYLIYTLLSRVFAVNDEDYKAVHFEHFDGPADYSSEQMDHYLGLSSAGLRMALGWQNRHEAFTTITAQGLNRLSHERVAEIINDMTKVMWRKWRWGHGFWWEEKALRDPNADLPADAPNMERTLEYVPNVWDSDFRRPTR